MVLDVILSEEGLIIVPSYDEALRADFNKEVARVAKVMRGYRVNRSIHELTYILLVKWLRDREQEGMLISSR